MLIGSGEYLEQEKGSIKCPVYKMIIIRPTATDCAENGDCDRNNYKICQFICTFWIKLNKN